MALGPLTVGAPLGLWLATAAVPLVAAYFLRRKQPALRVSALFLWKTPALRAEGGPRLQRFNRERSLFIELLAVAAATFFVADVHCGGASLPRPALVAVVDGSLSMGAHAVNQASALSRARAELLRRMDDAGGVTLVQSGPHPKVWCGPNATRGEAETALQRLESHQAGHGFLRSLELARDLSGARGVVLFTDHLPDEPMPDWVEVVSVGQPLENDAVTYAARTDVAGKASITLRVTHFGANAAQVRVKLRADAAQKGGAPFAEDRLLELGPNGSQLFRARLEHVGPVRVSLESDALEADGELTLWPTEEQELRVGFSSKLAALDQHALRRFFEAMPGVRPDDGDPELRFGTLESDFEVVIGTTGERRAFLGPFFQEKNDSLLEDVGLEGVMWSAGENPVGRPLMSAGGRVLVSREESGRIHLNIDLGHSNVQRAPAWPILLANIVREARAKRPGLHQRHAMLGEEVRLSAPTGSSYTLAGPGMPRALLPPGSLTLPPLPEPGDYRLERNGKLSETLTVWAIDPIESDLRSLSPDHRPMSVDNNSLLAAHLAPPPLWWAAALLLLLLWDFRVTRASA